MQKDSGRHFDKGALAAPGHILVATDLTDMEYLAPHAIAQAKTTGASITLVHAILPSQFSPGDPAAIPYADRVKIIRDARLMLQELAHPIEAQGITCSIAARAGSAKEVIRDQLHETGAERLILGTHGRGKLGQLTLGSVAQELISSANIPVFLVGPHARKSVEHVTPRKILHPVSLEGDYLGAFDLAIALGQTYKAEVTLLHVLDRKNAEGINPERTVEWAKHALEELAPDNLSSAPLVHTLVTTGALAEEVVKVADQTAVDWIVLGAEGGHRFAALHEHAAYQVLTRATCPVLTLRHERYRAQRMKREEVHFTSPM